MLASIALVGCTNDDLIVNEIEDNKQQSELVRGDAYVNFVINTKTDSSRGTVGDGDGTSDDSTHKLAGTKEENTVHKLLLVVAKAKDNSTEDAIELYENVNNVNEDEANKPNGELSKVRNGYVGYFTFTENNPYTNNNKLVNATVQGSNVIKLNTPIRLDYTGKYAVLAVVNPVDDLVSQIAEGSDYLTAYNTILNYAGEAYNKNAVAHFQMSNKEPELITADPNNTPENPVVANIAVERTVSKTTWRWKEADATLGNETLKTLENLYPVTVTGFNKTPVLGTFWYKKLMEEGTTNEYTAYTYSEKFNKATGTDNKTYWVLFKENTTDNGSENTDNKGQIIWTEVQAIFLDTDNKETYKGVTDVQDDGKESLIGQEKTAPLLSENYSLATTRVTADFVSTLSFVYDTKTAIDEQYYVHLTHYALTNLTPTVYAVRHIDTGAEKPRIMGLLGYTDYLYTPYYETINANGTYSGFNQSLNDVKDEAASFATGVPTETIFDELPTSVNSQKLGEVTISHDGVTEVGGFMEYLYENSCKNGKIGNNDIANPETVTGIVLAGDIYDKDGVKVHIMYKYNEKFYRTLQALIEACGDQTTNTFTNNNKTITPNSTNEDATAAGIDVYPQGRCFYYSAQIKHFEDSSPKEIGVMEYAIMRNNIYSLAVKSIEGIGDARITVTENDPLTDIRSYVQLEVSILPWIVRFNDLEL